MNYLDVALALPLLWGVYRGFTKGLIISVATLAALILGVFAAVYFSSFFGGYINNWFHPNPKHLKILSFALTFVLVVIVVRLIGWGLDKLIKAVALGFANRLLGVFFNVLKWAFILSVLISIMDSTEGTRNLINAQSKEESVLYRPISKIAPFVFPFLKFIRIQESIDTPPQLPVVEKQI
jgi:membrane protein required for colicin V production